MPLIEKIGDISLYGSGHSNAELPYLESFLKDTTPRSLYIEANMDNPVKRLMRADGKFASDYAEQNGILLRHAGYSVDKLPVQLARKYPIATVVDDVFKCLDGLIDDIEKLQENPQYRDEVPEILRETYRELLGLLPDKEAFTGAVQRYLKWLSIGITAAYIRPGILSQSREQVMKSIDEMEQYISGMHTNLVGESERPMRALSEEDIAIAYEIDLGGTMVPSPVRSTWKDYKKEFLELSNTEMWKNMRPHIRTDPKPIGIIMGYQHFPHIEDRVRRSVRRQ